jgi:proteasome lid subunit RPN8/RPN11
MKYCQVVLESPSRGRIYQKDFDGQHVFGPLVQVLVSELVRQNVAQEGELYRALVIPRYENTLIQNPIILRDQAKAQIAPSTWLTLEFDSISHEPLTFFTLELRFPDSGFIYTQDLQIITLEYLWQNLQTALLRMRVLKNGDQYIPRLYFRDDEQANFEYEEVHFADDDEEEPLIELVEVEDTPPQFALKSPDEFNILETQEVTLVSPVELPQTDPSQQDSLRIFIARNTLEAIQDLARRDVQVEQGGVLVGCVYCNTQAEDQYLIEISDHIVAENASANVVELRYNFDSWLQQNIQLREQYPGKQIVGWYHTHLVQIAVPSETEADQLQTTELFFSPEDRFMHRRFFNDRWYVAMVLGPQGNTAFFRWFGDKISANRCYHVIPPASAPCP